ncbi:GNAT family N-acetyltransferase [Vibrio neptunius]|uniref:GNAT family N-acetyltransferase n=1 Tax=Vibrio neptunius TaxID=170651 RepID=A0ABS3A4U6_9VIBR|nr:GNAT family N-acetyltransferase [Vibrio neptunius]MBN3495853.1 GNAT family N-acetyltransferase [Vibrio neptunius]MBN3518270.1 GNAT family N-acetyltransferase [Vibrio neptunius]MBN3552605.1 GNAT family N-acetyltransferase [Vibrio neptunius]MBN3579490.1 GNAT family N-acetyltransferase [Vibrio neptunius]MCH9873154.1 GNAT family N-acetyltransferase [Vibrio neptunius]
MEGLILIIRKAKVDEISRLLELEQCVIDAERPYNSSLKEKSAYYYDIERLISCHNSHLLVAEVDNEIVGTGYAQIRNSKPSLEHEQHCYLGFMYVSPNYRGQGINFKLVSKLIDWSKRRRIFDFYLDVYADNDSAVKAYEKVGFKGELLEMKLCLTK